MKELAHYNDRVLEVVTSPAAEALEFLTMEGGAQVQSGSDTIDPQNLLIDLNDLLRYGRNSIPFASVVKKITDLPGGKSKTPYWIGHFCLPFLPATPSSLSLSHEGFNRDDVAPFNLGERCLHNYRETRTLSGVLS